MKTNTLPLRQRSILKILALIFSFTLLLLLVSPPVNKTIAVQTQSQVTATVTLTPTPTLTATPENSLITKTNAAQLMPLHSWQAHVQSISSLSFSPDLIHLVSTGNDQLNGTSPIRVWDRKSRQAVDISFEGIQPFGFAWTASYSENGLYILGIASTTGTTVWNASDGKRVARIGQGGSYANFIKKELDYRIVVGSDDGLIGIWNVPILEPANSPNREAMGITDEELLEYQKELLLTAFQIGEPLIDYTVNKDTGQVFALATSGNVSILTWEFINGVINTRVETITQESQSSPLEPISVSDSKIVLSPDRNALAFTGNYRDVVIWNTETRKTIARYVSEKPITCLMFSPDSELLIVTDYAIASSIQVLNSNTGEVVTTFNPGNSISSCAFSPDGTLFATGSSEGQITIWGVPLT